MFQTEDKGTVRLETFPIKVGETEPPGLFNQIGPCGMERIDSDTGGRFGALRAWPFPQEAEEEMMNWFSANGEW